MSGLRATRRVVLNDPAATPEPDSGDPSDYPGCQFGTSLTPPMTKPASIVTTVPVI